jgi:hypothetical protein
VVIGKSASDARCEGLGPNDLEMEIKMDAEAGKKVGFLTVQDGGLARERRTHAEREVERAIRALFYAMEGRKGKNLRNVARGATHPARMLLRRFREAKRARKDGVNYPLAKQTVREIDAFVDSLFNRDVYTTGDRPKVA